MMTRDDLFSQMDLELEGFESTDQALETVSHDARAAVDADDAGVMLMRRRCSPRTRRSPYLLQRCAESSMRP